MFGSKWGWFGRLLLLNEIILSNTVTLISFHFDKFGQRTYVAYSCFIDDING